MSIKNILSNWFSLITENMVLKWKVGSSNLYVGKSIWSYVSVVE